MALQRVFTQDYAEQLRTHISPDDYIGDCFTYDETHVKSLMNVVHPEGLAEYLEEHYDNDFECAVYLYKAFRNISPIMAQDDRLWTYLSHVDLFCYLKKRWPIPTNSEKQYNHIRDHWFRGVNSIIRSSLMGLWWAVYCTIDEDNSEDEFRLTRALFSNYSFRTVFFGSTELFWYKNATQGILSFIVDNPEIFNQGFENRGFFISKYFNQLGGIKQLASMDKEFFYRECEKIKSKLISIKSREDVMNRIVLSSINE